MLRVLRVCIIFVRQIMFHDELMMDVIGCMESNPNKPHPIRHREYVAKSSKYKEVIKFSNPDLLPKIHQTYRQVRVT